MKINTISAYVLVYLLARGHWNLMVPVRADVEGDGSSASASADAGSAPETPADGSTPAAPASESGSSASPDAGLTAGDGSGHVAGGSDADGSAGSSPEGASSGDASNGAGLASGEGDDGGSSGHDSTVADELGSLYPDFYTGGVSADEAPITSPDVIAGKKEAAKRMADDARKAAEEAIKAAEKMMKAAEDLTEAIGKTDDTIKIEAEMQKLSAAVEDSVYVAKVGKSIVVEDADPLDMSYYSGFPDGWHKQADFEVFEKMYKEPLMYDNLMYYSGFPNGWHRHDDGGLQDIRNFLIKQEAEKVRAKIVAKKEEIDRVKKQIDDLTEVYNVLDSEIKKLEAEHKDLEKKLLGLDASLIKLYKADSDGNLVELLENTDFEKRKAQGDIRFLFKSNVECTLVKYGEHELWKKGERDVDVPKLVAFNDTVNVIAVRDDGRAVLFKKETSSDKWYYHSTVLRQSRTAAQMGSAAQPGSSAAPAPGALTTGLSASKLELDTASTGTPESAESLEAEETASVASGEGSEPNEADSGTALRGSTVGSADGGSSSGGSAEAKEGSAGSEYSSVFMD